MSVRQLRSREKKWAATSATRAQIVGWEPRRGVVIAFREGGTALAQSLVNLSARDLDQASRERREVLITYEDGDPDKPVIVGLLAPIPAAAQAESDPEFVVVKGRQSVRIQCGAASLTLHKDGKVVLRGTKVISRATEENSISGASVRLN
jgi:hypothetical protein